jgi:paraquat-inducible protein B
VRPEVGIGGNITGLGTVISGPVIGVLPGTGKAKSEFIGLDSSPVALEHKGLKIVLRSSALGSLRPNSAVNYRGIEVGVVQDTQLSRDATAVDIHVFIKQRYAHLVRNGSKFWNVSGLDISVGLFRGVEINMESLRSLVAGGIAFATPNDPQDKPARNGTVFPLHDKPQKDWLKWMPRIPIPPES